MILVVHPAFIGSVPLFPFSPSSTSMQRPHLDKKIFAAILSGSYSQLEENHFASLCISLADEAVDHHIYKRRLTEDSRRDLVHDAFVKLFVRNSSGEFPRIGEYIKKSYLDFDDATEEELLRTLRSIIAGGVYQAMIENLKRRDKVLSDILRSIDYGLKSTELFYKTTRFNDKCLIPRDIDRLAHHPPIPYEIVLSWLRQSTSEHQTVPQLLRKLHAVLTEQEQYQRILSIVDVALLFKDIRRHIQPTEISADTVETDVVRADLTRKIEEAALRVYEQMYPSYVGKAKWTESEYKAGLAAARDVFLRKIQPGNNDEESFFQLLREHLPELTRQDYSAKHKHRLEYLVALMKNELKGLGDELRRR